MHYAIAISMFVSQFGRYFQIGWVYTRVVEFRERNKSNELIYDNKFHTDSSAMKDPIVIQRWKSWPEFCIDRTFILRRSGYSDINLESLCD